MLYHMVEVAVQVDIMVMVEQTILLVLAVEVVVVQMVQCQWMIVKVVELDLMVQELIEQLAVLPAHQVELVVGVMVYLMDEEQRIHLVEQVPVVSFGPVLLELSLPPMSDHKETGLKVVIVYCFLHFSGNGYNKGNLVCNYLKI